MQDYPNDWTQSDIEYCSYCENCGKPIKDGDEEHYDAGKNLCCSQDCVDECNSDKQ